MPFGTFQGVSVPVGLEWHHFKAGGNKVVPAHLEGSSLIELADRCCGRSRFGLRACRNQERRHEPAGLSHTTLEVRGGLKNGFRNWAGATRPSIPSNLGWGGGQGGNDLQLLEGLWGDGTFRLGLELRQPARLAR